MLYAPVWTEDKRAHLRLMVETGLTMREIAHRMGTTPKAIQHAARRYHIAFPPRPRIAKLRPEPRSSAPKFIAIECTSLRTVKVDALNISLVDLKPRQCRYAVTEDGPHLFCGQPQQDGSPYCAAHHNLCYPPAQRPSGYFVARSWRAA